MAKVIFTSFFLLLTLLLGVSAEQCGRQARGALRAGGDTDSYCGDGCRSQRGGGGRVGYVGDIITRERFEEMLKYRDDSRCHAVGFYTYEDFISAAKAFPDFGNTGDNETRERELAAFFGQTSHETTGGWPDAPDGPYAWGYCYNKEVNPPYDYYCDPSPNIPNCTCAPGKQYYGRGPIQLSWNYNYCPCGEAIGEDLLNNPDLVETDGLISFKAAIWFWMTAQPPKPSCHDVIIGNWTPSQADIDANRYPGYGVLINIINGGIECGKGVPNPYVEDRIGFYKRYCDLFGIRYGDNLDCYNQLPFGNGLSELVNSM